MLPRFCFPRKTNEEFRARGQAQMANPEVFYGLQPSDENSAARYRNLSISLSVSLSAR